MRVRLSVSFLTAFRLAFEDDINVQGVYTYGAPAVGNSSFASLYADHVKNTHRWNIQQDPVPLFLPVANAFPPGPFRHVGTRNNLYMDIGFGSKVVLDDSVELVYVMPFLDLISVAAQIYYDLSVTHMSYESRIRDEYTLQTQ